MSAKIKINSIVTGKVTGIQQYGAFVAIDEETSGLIHISEITNGFVKNIKEYLDVGDTVKAIVVDLDDDLEKISLSIRALEDENEQQSKQSHRKKDDSELIKQIETEDGFKVLKEKLQEWIAHSNFT